MTTCSLEGCERKREAKGFCFAHYQRWRKGTDLAGPILQRAKPGTHTGCSVKGCHRGHDSHGMCATHVRRLKNGEEVTAPIPGDFKVKVSSEGCWEAVYPRPADADGYTRLTRGGKVILAHRWMYEQWHGQIAAGLVIDHLCRNPPCVNPNHLEPVSQIENTRRGSHVKLSPSIVNEIRRSVEPALALAKRYGVTQVTITKVRRGATWKTAA